MYNDSMIKICNECKIENSFINYKRGKDFKYYFNKLEDIEKNYSQAYQDMFVLSVTNGKMNGTYLEIGAGDPSFGNNSYLLESMYNWFGVSIDIDAEISKNFNKNRVNMCINKDATEINYSELLSRSFTNKDIDYLQIDCDPPLQSYKILQSIPFDEYSFSVITFEHDHFCDSENKYRMLSRQFLQSAGYILVVGNVAVGKNFPFEDWWVHPKLMERINELEILNIDKSVLCIEEHMLNNFNYPGWATCTHNVI